MTDLLQRIYPQILAGIGKTSDFRHLSRTYLLTYVHSWLRAYKTSNISEIVKRLKIERKLLRTDGVQHFMPKDDEKSAHNKHVGH